MTRAIVFGANGATGKQIVAAAVAKQWEVTAFVRDATRAPAGARVLEGNVDDAAAVASAVRTHDIVISALGVSRPLKPDPAVVRGVEHIIAAMRSAGVRRLIYMSFVGVQESRGQAGWLIRNVARHPLRHEIADHERKEALIKASDLDWTIVRPPKLTDGLRTDRYRDGEQIQAGRFFPRLSRADVASFIVERALDRATYRRATTLMPA